MSDDLYRHYMDVLEKRFGHIPFRVAETPLFLTHELRDRLKSHALDLAAQLSAPEMVAKCRRAVPAQFDAPGMDALPNTVQVDFALVPGKDGGIDGQLIELQGFPSASTTSARSSPPSSSANTSREIRTTKRWRFSTAARCQPRASSMSIRTVR